MGIFALLPPAAKAPLESNERVLLNSAYTLNITATVIGQDASSRPAILFGYDINMVIYFQIEIRISTKDSLLTYRVYTL